MILSEITRLKNPVYAEDKGSFWLMSGDRVHRRLDYSESRALKRLEYTNAIVLKERCWQPNYYTIGVK